jgi:hypothetical protein
MFYAALVNAILRRGCAWLVKIGVCFDFNCLHAHTTDGGVITVVRSEVVH